MSRIEDRNIWIIYATSLVLGLAYGLAIAVIALYMDQVGYSKQDIGTLAAWFAGGIVAFSLPAGRFIKRFGARQVLVTCLLVYAGAVLVLPLAAHSFWVLVFVRVLDGAASVGIWISCETMLLQRASASNKAFVMSLYAISVAVGYIAGPIAARFITPVAPLEAAFAVAGTLAIVSALVATRLERRDPTGTEEHGSGAPPRMQLGTLLWKIKNSCLATFSYGYFQAAIVLFLPLYLDQSKHLPVDQIVVIPAWFAAGMFTFSTIAGRIADRGGHLRVMVVLALAGIPCIVFVPDFDSYWLIAISTFFGGATLASISPVSLAFQGHVIPIHEQARANSIYNAFYASGTLLGPPVTAQIFARLGGPAMLYHFGMLWAFFAVFAMVFYRDDPRRHAALEPATAT